MVPNALRFVFRSGAEDRLPKERNEGMIREVMMYRAECDHEGCAASPQDAGDFYAWKEPDATLWDADDCDWYKTDGVLLCDEHAPRCAAEDCDLQLFSDEFGKVCEDCASVSSVSGVSS